MDIRVFASQKLYARLILIQPINLTYAHNKFFISVLKRFLKSVESCCCLLPVINEFQKGIPSGANLNVKGVESAIYFKKKYDIYIFVF